MYQYIKKTANFLSNHHYLLIFFWSASILLIGLIADQSIIAHDEGLYATRAKTMFETGDWVNPWEQPHHKPPGTYWLIAFMYLLGGVNELALRSPTLLIAIACSFLVYEIAKLLFGQTIALAAALILNLEFLWVRYSYLANPDHPTIFLFLLAIWSLLRYQKQFDKTRKIQASKTDLFQDSNYFKSDTYSYQYLLIMGACLALMVVFRGFYALMLITSLTPYLLITHRPYQYFQKASLYIGLSLGLLPLGIWLYLSFQRFDVRSFQALLDLFVDLSREEREGNKQLYYIWNTLSLCFPWIFFAGIGFITEFKKSNYHQKFLSIGIPSGIFLMITLYETRISHYALSLYPFIAILAALGIHTLLKIKEEKPDRKIIFNIISFGLMALGSLALFGSILYLLFGQFLFGNTDIKPFIYIALPIATAWTYLGIAIYKKHSDTSWLLSLLLGQWLTLLLLNSSGLITDINPDFKQAMLDKKVQSVVQDQAVILLAEGKNQVLLKFYTPMVNYRINTFAEVKYGDYVWLEQEHLPKQVNEYQVISTYKDLKLVKIVRKN